MTEPKFDRAFDNLMVLEGGKTTDHAGPTNFGITLRNLQHVGDMDFDKDQDGDLDKRDLWAFTREDAKVYVYRHWWSNIRLDEITSPEVASKALDIIYNCGVSRGTKILQQACNRFGKRLVTDGKIGPQTLRAANSICGESLTAALKSEQRSWYLYLINRDPAVFKKYERGWLRRADS